MTCITCKTENRHTLHHDQRESPALEPARQNRYTNPLHTASAGRSRTFAVATIRDWYRDGEDVQARLPVLSTMPGHIAPVHTYWYVTATPDLLALAAQRLHDHLGDLP